MAKSSCPGKETPEDRLSKRFWWWRKGTKDWEFDYTTFTTEMKSSSTNTEWKAGRELVEWWYELVIRHTRTVNMTMTKEDLLLYLEDYSLRRPRREVLRINQIPVSEDGFVRNKGNWSGIFPMEIDLSASDHELSSHFLRFAKTERERRNKGRKKRDKIGQRRGPEGKRHRSVSWRWPELLDMAHYIERPRLDEKERKKLSRARKLAKSLYEYMTDIFSTASE